MHIQEWIARALASWDVARFKATTKCVGTVHVGGYQYTCTYVNIPYLQVSMTPARIHNTVMDNTHSQRVATPPPSALCILFIVVVAEDFCTPVWARRRCRSGIVAKFYLAVVPVAGLTSLDRQPGAG